VPHVKLHTTVTVLPSRAFIPLGKAGAIDVRKVFVTPSTAHPTAQALREVDNHLPVCQRAGQLPIDSMTQLRRSLARRLRNCFDSLAAESIPSSARGHITARELVSPPFEDVYIRACADRVTPNQRRI
jgi:hypothetical protein